MINWQKKGNQMYPWVNATWNPIKGCCSHQCSYCYYQSNPRFKKQIGKLRLDEKCFKDNLGEDNTIFVGSSTDMFADAIPKAWIERVLEYCQLFDNTYLFQTKNPKRFEDFPWSFPPKSFFGVTIETNRENDLVNIPLRSARFSWMCTNPKPQMISIEPIMDFDLVPFVIMIKNTNPLFVSIGADSNGSGLPEPSPEKVNALIKELEKFTEVKVKPNLKRLMK